MTPGGAFFALQRYIVVIEGRSHDTLGSINILRPSKSKKQLFDTRMTIFSRVWQDCQFNYQGVLGQEVIESSSHDQATVAENLVATDNAQDWWWFTWCS